MRILYVIHNSIWPATYGSAIRGYNILKGLEQEHDVAIALANKNPAVIEGFLQGHERQRQLHVLDLGQPFLANKLIQKTIACYRSDLLPRAQGICGKSFSAVLNETNPDLVWYFNALSMWIAGGSGGRPCVLDFDDLDSRKYAMYARQAAPTGRMIMSMDRFLMSMQERCMANQANVALFSNGDDLSRIKFNTKVVHMPNGFDFSAEPRLGKRNSQRLLFMGYLDYQPNFEGIHWFCKSVWPRVLESLPDAGLDILGRAPEAKLKLLRDCRNVIAHGFVENVDEFMADASGLVVPLRIGGGTRIKILEAWAKGLPVVSTSIGCEGLGAVDSKTVLIGDDVESLAKHCIRLLQSPADGQRLAENAYIHGKARFDWQNLYGLIDQIADSAVRSEKAV